MKVRVSFTAIIALLHLLWFLASSQAVSAHANLDRSEPVAGSANPVAPTEIRLFFTENPEPKYSEIKVYDANLKRYDQGSLRPIQGDPLGLAIDVVALPEGVYTVAWKANSAVDGHTTEGSFAFAVGNLPPPVTTSNVGDTQFTAPTPAEIVIRWLTILAATMLVGALGLRVLVWQPALRASGQAEVAPGSPFEREVARRLLLLVGASLVILLLGTVAGLVLQAAKVTGRSALGALDGAVLTDFLFETRAGGIWAVRLLLPIVALMLLGPLLLAALRRGSRGRRAEGRGQQEGEEDEAQVASVVPTYFGLALGVAYLLTISLISHAAANPFWVPFTVALDWLHLLGTAVWVGGLGGLVLTVPLVRRLGPALRPVLAQVVSRFSTLALISVGVLSVTGLYSAWLHVGSLDAMLPTTYGRTLTIKLVLFAGLIGLGAFNLLWLRLRLAVGEHERVGAILLRHFGRAIRLEVLLGVAVLLAVAILTTNVPAREAIIEARAPKRAQTVTVGDVKLTLTLSSLQPGNTAFDVYLQEAKGGRPIADAARVALRVTHADMDMGEAEAIATSRGDGHYSASGSYLSMSGAYDIRAIVRRANVADIDQTFKYPIGSTANLANDANKLTAPQLPPLNSLRGIGFVAIGIGLLLTAFGVPFFRRGSGLGTALLMLAPTALVVGGYLVYTGPGSEPAFKGPSRSPGTAPVLGSVPTSVPTARPLTPGPGGEERLIYAFDGHIWSLGLGGGPPVDLTPDLPRGAYANDPALSPDGTVLAYAVLTVPGIAVSAATPGVSQPSGSIWRTDLTDGNKRQVLLPDQPGVTIRSLAWAADGQALIYTFTALVLGSDGRYLSSRTELQHFDLATGTRSTLIAGAQDASFSPVGSAASLAYVLVDPQTRAPSLWLADRDGRFGRQLVGSDGQFLSIGSPRFSPDGTAILFVASGGPTTEPGSAAEPRAELWVISPAGGGLRRLTNLRGDLPSPTWSPDGRRIAFLTSGGLFVINADGSDLAQLSDRGSASRLIWTVRRSGR